MKKSAGVLITYDKKLLMLLRDNNPEIADPDCWQLIGGQIEKGETSIETLIRETKEESNLEIKETEIKEIGKIIVPEKQEYFLYWIKLSEEQTKDIKLGNEGQKIDFILLEDLDKMKLGTNLSNYFQRYREGLRNVVEYGVLNKKLLGFDENNVYYINSNKAREN